jgi:hypothetical protein
MPYRPFTPLLVVLLLLSLLFAVICYSAGHELVGLRALQIIGAASVALCAGHRLLLR